MNWVDSRNDLELVESAASACLHNNAANQQLLFSSGRIFVSHWHESRIFSLVGQGFRGTVGQRIFDLSVEAETLKGLAEAAFTEKPELGN